MICRHCGCDKPCPCDGYSTGDTCSHCGCTKPCACDDYMARRPETNIGNGDYFRAWLDDDDGGQP